MRPTPFHPFKPKLNMENNHDKLERARWFLNWCEEHLARATNEVAKLENELAKASKDLDVDGRGATPSSVDAAGKRLPASSKRVAELTTQLAAAKGEARAKACIVDVAKAKCRELARIHDSDPNQT